MEQPNQHAVYQWTVGQHTRSTTWTNTVRNRFRQKAGEIEAFRALEIGAANWCKEHIPRKGNDLNDLTEEGISLLDDTESVVVGDHDQMDTAPGGTYRVREIFFL